MRLAILQVKAVPGDVVANLAMIGGAARLAAAQGADLLVAPELATTGYGAGDVIRDLAEPADGPQSAALSEISRNAEISLVVGFAERDGGTIWNSALLIERGTLRYCYRKRHLWGDYERNLFSAARRGSPVFEIAGVKIGLAICYDIEFPETARALALAGADLVLVPTALPENEYSGFIAERLLQVRAFENQIFVAYVDHAGSDANFTYAGRSCIVAPDGSDLARAGRSDAELLIADVDPAAFAQCRVDNPYLQELAACLPDRSAA
jgi:predicted amidohydrolase